MAKVNISIPDELLQRLDEYADSNYQSRSGAISMMVNQYLLGQQLQGQMGVLVDSMKKIADGNNLSEEDVKALTGLEALMKQVNANR